MIWYFFSASRAIALVLGLEAARVDGVADRDQHALALERLLDEIERAEPRRLDRGRDVGVAGDHDDRRDLDEVPQLLQHFEAVHARHLDVEEHQVGRLALDQLDAFLAGGRLHHVVAVVFERHLQRVADRRLVVDDRMRGFTATPCGPCGWRADRARARRGRSPGRRPGRAAPTMRRKPATEFTGWRLISRMIAPRSMPPS